jgi:hypothetical protein
MQFEIRAGDHVPDLPFVIVNRQGIHVDLTGIGELWDGPTTAMVQWGLISNAGIEFGRVTLKDGTSRNFHDRDLTLPYVKAHKLAWAAAMAEHDRVKAEEAARPDRERAARIAARVAVAHDIANMR